MKKEPVTLSPDHTSTSREQPRDNRLITLEAHTASSSSRRTSSETKKEIEHLKDHFRSLQVNRLYQPKVNPTNLTKNWYPRPTPPDLQYEERNTQFTVSIGKLYEWNIDGLSEQEILNKIQHMTMVANNYLNDGL